MNKKGLFKFDGSNFEVLSTLFIKSLIQVIGMSSLDVNISSRLIFLDSDHHVINEFSLKFICQMNVLSKPPVLANFGHCFNLHFIR